MPILTLQRETDFHRRDKRLAPAELKNVRELANRLARQRPSQLLETANETRAEIQQSSRINRQHLTRLLGIGCAAIRQVMGFDLHDVQIEATIRAACGASIQMQTGEGKTVVASMIAFVRSHIEPVHLSTTNAYLAQRDHEEMSAFFRHIGCTSGLISHDQPKTARRQAYRQHITFGPGYQFGFDYLADQLTLRDASTGQLGTETIYAINGIDIESLLLQPESFGTMIIDEADSVMIDEAMTPLILSGQTGEPEDTRPYELADRFAESLSPGEDWTLGDDGTRIELHQSTVDRAWKVLDRQRRRFLLVRPWQEYVQNAVHARFRFRRNEHYVVADEKVKIVDQFTGRIFDDRQWQAGLHQAVEAKESVPINSGNRTLAQITRQRYFGRYRRLIGLSGTFTNLARELRSVYGMTVAQIPTNRPCQRKILPTRAFVSTENKLAAIVHEVTTRHASGQPVLIGTRTIAQSLSVHKALDHANIECVLLNGIQDQDEATIVSQAGRHAVVTIATNMAGRGTDIKLDARARKTGGLFVLGFEHNFSERIDRQLAGRCARQGDPGAARFFAALDDELFESANPTVCERLARNADHHGEIHADLTDTIRHLQSTAERKARQQRKQLNLHGNWLNRVRRTLSDETVE